MKHGLLFIGQLGMVIVSPICSFNPKVIAPHNSALPFKRINLPEYEVNFIKLFVFQNKEYLAVCGNNDKIAIFDIDYLAFSTQPHGPILIIKRDN